MPKVTLIYFSQCPNVNRARDSIVKAGINDFSEINQDTISNDHPYKQFSSPTILVDGEIIAGSRNGAASCSIIQWDAVINEIIKRSTRA